MAIAKNIALHGIWGVTKYEFSSSSSSLLWTSMLALIFRIFGASQMVPLILNIIFAVLILVFIYVILKSRGFPGWFNFSILCCFIILPPLLPLAFTGLEHVLHILAAIMFLYYASLLLSADGKNLRLIAAVVSLGILLPVIRYEGIVIVAASAFLFILQKRFWTALCLTVLPLIPIFAFGIYSISKGWSFFPNSLLLKGSLPDVYSLGDFIRFVSALSSSFMPFKVFVVVSIAFVLFVLSGTIYIWIRKPPSLKSVRFNILFLFGANVVLYLVYARSGWSYRYQSFLVSLLLLVVILLLRKETFSFSTGKVKSLKAKLSIVFLILVICLLSYNGFRLTSQAPTTSNNIYEQQFQMASFLSKFYQNEGVALNDIGASNYFADIKCIDLWGLSNLQISKIRREGNFDSGIIREITQKEDVKIAIVYDSWFDEEGGSILPSEWIKTGRWKISNNIIAGDDVVSFYAVSRIEAQRLEGFLKQYSQSLPSDVSQSIWHVTN